MGTIKGKQQKANTMKTSFIKSIGKTRINGLAADLYENSDGSAVIKFDKNAKSLPASKNLNFNSIEIAERFIEVEEGPSGLDTLINVLEAADLY